MYYTDQPLPGAISPDQFGSVSEDDEGGSSGFASEEEVGQNYSRRESSDSGYWQDRILRDFDFKDEEMKISGEEQSHGSQRSAHQPTPQYHGPGPVVFRGSAFYHPHQKNTSLP